MMVFTKMNEVLKNLEKYNIDYSINTNENTLSFLDYAVNLGTKEWINTDTYSLTGKVNTLHLSISSFILDCIKEHINKSYFEINNDQLTKIMYLYNKYSFTDYDLKDRNVFVSQTGTHFVDDDVNTFEVVYEVDFNGCLVFDYSINLKEKVDFAEFETWLKDTVREINNLDGRSQEEIQEGIKADFYENKMEEERL